MRSIEWLIILASLPALIPLLLLLWLKDLIFGAPPIRSTLALGAFVILACLPIGLCFWGWVIYQMICHLRWV